jgi:hypothetical protein
MIVKDPEKKACGLISVTWITVRAHVSALPGPHGGAATVYNRRSASYGPRAHAVMPSRLPPWKDDTGRRHGGANDA